MGSRKSKELRITVGNVLQSQRIGRWVIVQLEPVKASNIIEFRDGGNAGEVKGISIVLFHFFDGSITHVWLSVDFTTTPLSTGIRPGGEKSGWLNRHLQANIVKLGASVTSISLGGFDVAKDDFQFASPIISTRVQGNQQIQSVDIHIPENGRWRDY